MSSLTALLVLLVTLLTAASPVLTKIRIKSNNFIDVQCRGPGNTVRKYTADHQKDVARQARADAQLPIPNRLHSGGPRPKEQPHRYHPNTPDKSPAVDEVLDLMPLCHSRLRGRTWFLYPILETGAAFANGDDPGPDRVLLVASGSGPGHYTDFVYCGTVFHENQHDGFEPCYET